jgi:hypothetical protein
LGEQLKKGCCNIPSCNCHYGIYTIGNNFDTSDYTGMTAECEATLNALDVRIREFEEFQRGL